MTNVVLVDLYGTILEQGLDESPVKMVKRRLDIQCAFQQYIERFQDTFMCRNYDSLRDAFKATCEEFDVDVSDQELDRLVGDWNKNALLTKEYNDVQRGLKEIPEEYAAVLVANVDEFTFEQIDAKFDLRERFDDTYLSFETGYLKNSEEALDQIVAEHNSYVESSWIIGDSMNSDIHPGETYGFKTILVDRRNNRDYEPRRSSFHKAVLHIKE
jgi:FMN phosphatase YigB (HAD superfamily)